MKICENKIKKKVLIVRPRHHELKELMRKLMQMIDLRR